MTNFQTEIRQAPTVSVIMPAYETASFIAESLDSALSQTFCDFEIIVVNDGSPDTAELERVLEPYAEDIVYIKQANRGLSGARNMAIRSARGEFVALLDSDDTWDPTYLEEQLKTLHDEPTLDAIYCDARFFGDTPWLGKGYTEVFPPKTLEINFETILRRDCPMMFTCSIVVRRKVFEEVGLFDEQVRMGEDQHMWMRVAHRGKRFAYTGKLLANRRVRPHGALTSVRERVEQGDLHMLERLLTEPDLSDAERSAIKRTREVWQAAIDLRLGKEALGRGDVARATGLLASANAVLRTKKLRAVLAGLRLSPGLARAGVRIWWGARDLLETDRHALIRGVSSKRAREAD